MNAPNPYAAPQTLASRPGPGPAPGTYGEPYVPLGWRTALAAISVAGMTLVDVFMRVAQLLLVDTLAASVRAGAPDMAAAALIGVTGLGVVVLSVCSWVFVPIWIYRAAANLRGLGRYGMAFSPGGCIGWFFVPIANLWKPAQAMAEIWRASDPQADEGSWVTAPGTPIVAVWWAAWIVSGVVSWGALLAKGDPSAAATIGLVSTLFRAVAAVGLVVLMRGISARQEQTAARRLAAP